MGGEVLILPAVILGMALCLLLIYRAFKLGSRPFALPTLIFSFIWSLYFACMSKPEGWFWTHFFMNFIVGALIFGAQAHLIKWLYEKRT